MTRAQWMLVLVLILLCDVGAMIARPSFPASYHMIQLSRCISESVFCPAGFVNETGASQSYYDGPNQRAAAQDTYNLNEDAVKYATDQTFVSAFNASHLETRLYFLTPGDSTVQCFSTLFAGALPSNDPLADAKYVGTEMFDGVLANKFQTPFLFYFATNLSILGANTVDGSQINIFKWIDAVPAYALNARAFLEPRNVTCTRTPRPSALLVRSLGRVAPQFVV